MKQRIEPQAFSPTQVVVIVTTEDDEGRANFAPHGMFGIMSMEPPLLFISVIREHRTAQNIDKQGIFSINIPNTDLLDKMLFSGSISGNQQDKSKLFSLMRGESDIPYITDCPISMGCRVVQTIESDDMRIYIGRVIEMYADQACLDGEQPLPSKLDPILCTIESHFHRMGAPLKGDS